MRDIESLKAIVERKQGLTWILQSKFHIASVFTHGLRAMQQTSIVEFVIVNTYERYKMSALKQGYVVAAADGTQKIFDTAAEAREFIRLPQVKAAINALVAGDENFGKFLLENQDEIQNAFEAGVIARVTKAERNKLAKALQELLTVQNGKLKFLQDNHEAVLESFRWPAVKRLTPEEKTAATKEALVKLSDENIATWLITNRDHLERAYAAGVEKRAAPAGNGLAEYLAAKKAGPEALAKYTAAKAAAKEAAKNAAA